MTPAEQQQQQRESEGVPAAARRLPKAVTAAAFYDANSLKRPRAASPHGCNPESASSKRQQATPQPLNPLHAPYRTFKTQQAAFDFLDQQLCACILRHVQACTAVQSQPFATRFAAPHPTQLLMVHRPHFSLSNPPITPHAGPLPLRQLQVASVSSSSPAHSCSGIATSNCRCSSATAMRSSARPAPATCTMVRGSLQHRRLLAATSAATPQHTVLRATLS